MKILTAAVMLLALTACNSTGADTVAKPAQAKVGKPVPVAPPPPPMPDEGAACAADVKQCADGSFVSRNAAQGCAFNPCPNEGKP